MDAAALPMRIEATAAVELTVPFHDADPAGVAWHGNYFRYFDDARCALLERIGYTYRQMMDGGLYWPIVQAEVKYIRPLPFDRPEPTERGDDVDAAIDDIGAPGEVRGAEGQKPGEEDETGGAGAKPENGLARARPCPEGEASGDLGKSGGEEDQKGHAVTLLDLRSAR